MRTSPIYCPNCRAQYRVIGTEVAATSKLAREMICLSCGGPVNALEGDFVFKYLLVKDGGIDAS